MDENIGKQCGSSRMKMKVIELTPAGTEPEIVGKLGQHFLALTYPQLIIQALSFQLDEEALELLRNTYDLTEQLADGLYRGQGMPLVTHLVRTASILMAIGQPVEVVAAGMLHGVYLIDRMEGAQRRKAKTADRRMIQSVVGDRVEALVWGYSHLGWHQRGVIEDHLSRLTGYGTDKRSLLMVQLANELEDYLDLAVLFRCQVPYRQRIEGYGDLCVEMAFRLELPMLGQALKDAYHLSLLKTVPEIVIRGRRNGYELSHSRFCKRNLWEWCVDITKRGTSKALRMARIKPCL